MLRKSDPGATEHVSDGVFAKSAFRGKAIKKDVGLNGFAVEK